MLARFSRPNQSTPHTNAHVEQVNATDIAREYKIADEVTARLEFGVDMREKTGIEMGATVRPTKALMKLAAQAVEAKISPYPKIGERLGFESVRLATQWLGLRAAYLDDQAEHLAQRRHLVGIPVELTQRVDVLELATYTAQVVEQQQASQAIESGDSAVVELFATAESERLERTLFPSPYRDHLDSDHVDPFEADREIALRAVGNAVDAHAQAYEGSPYALIREIPVNLGDMNTAPVYCAAKREEFKKDFQPAVYFMFLYRHSEAGNNIIGNIILADTAKGMEMLPYWRTDRAKGPAETPFILDSLDALAIAKALHPDDQLSFDRPRRF